jgi:hypothetical protein
LAQVLREPSLQRYGAVLVEQATEGTVEKPDLERFSSVLDMARKRAEQRQSAINEGDATEVGANFNRLLAALHGLQQSTAGLVAAISPVLRTSVSEWPTEDESSAQEEPRTECDISAVIRDLVKTVQDLEHFVEFAVSQVAL